MNSRFMDDPAVGAIGQAINRLYLADETKVVREYLEVARLPAADAAEVRELAVRLVEQVRRNRAGKAGIEAFLQQYDLGSREGVILMCLAEALLRIPDADTADRLIADKIASGKWGDHLGEADSLFVNASTWGLMLTGKIVRPDESEARDPSGFLKRLVSRIGEPMVRGAFRQAMRIMGHQFVMGRNIGEALRRANEGAGARYRYTFDMLGEAALTAQDALRYFEAYSVAIREAGQAVTPGAPPEAWPSVSIKLSALFPRYDYAHRDEVLEVLLPRIEALAVEARTAGMAFTLDAEEADRLELSLELFDRLLALPALEGWAGLGLAVQAYQKRALDVIRWIQRRADETGHTINVRLVKGAYWDAEIKRAQERGLSGYPVFTRKQNSDVAYLACARLIFAGTRRVYPQFATHNAHTAASIMQMARTAGRDFEFQRLHGMGDELYAEIVDETKFNLPCRVYAPVGSHEDLLPYLVRRLLENGSNTSFVNRIVDDSLPAEAVVADPVAEVEALASIPHPRIPLPAQLFGAERVNSAGYNLADGTVQMALAAAANKASATSWRAAPVVGGRTRAGAERVLTNPADRSVEVGRVAEADAALVDEALSLAVAAQPEWDRRPPADRAAILDRTAALFEANGGELIAMCVREAGKSIPDSIAELREAVDFLRYYAAQLRGEFGCEQALPGPTGETNVLRLRGRGVFACISPWNFPLAIFTGQVCAALAAGNAVLAKPAEQTPLVAARAVQLLLEAGVPANVLHFLPGDGAVVGGRMTSDSRLAGVAFTGSNETVRLINQSLAARPGGLAVLIGETGGQNAMIVDSSALPEQVVNDVLYSGYNSAGQRCSALRVLFVQDEIAPRVLQLLAGAMDLLKVGDPASLETDVGPVIDEDAKAMLEAHATQVVATSRWHHRMKIDPACERGTFVAPLAVEIESLGQLTREVFGPIVHVVRWKSGQLAQVLDAINATGFGLTLGLHTRIDAVARQVAATVRVGNVYVNRNMIGAVVGVQPFGGCGLSGTGPKAGGPHYLHRFATEQVVTTNTTAAGGNTSLLSLDAG
ncbi:MAG: bifunctional proline dehydrogenase/L-glutamate gamma-semialdehyde dehydrogenase PutA [Gammaproteobacteria bacterium]|nr:bifunctional proline dehydrogenase/L-glutamate gamma-semialdehyde dehydrogenase PutA [Gammaproteobacteria bacterium]